LLLEPAVFEILLVVCEIAQWRAERRHVCTLRFDHSAPEKQGQRSWDAKRLLGRDNVADTVALVAALAARYATAPALLGFFLLNEPTVITHQHIIIQRSIYELTENQTRLATSCYASHWLFSHFIEIGIAWRGTCPER